MNITEVRIRRVDGTANLKAVASVTFDDEFVVHDIKIFEGKGGPFIAMPDKKIADGEYRDIAHPITSDFRKRLVTEVLSKYAILLSENPDSDTTEE
ncbi:MAG: septation regulator SpoVG [Firmicutes bacterium]|nr:septation regulator SpoVG [Bacillota bacterium]